MPEFIANQIAAGEVVQRPESVVKELVENSLDANATEIAIIIKDAGKQLIHIIDNGTGMSREDLELSIKRHSTSKIYTLEDLEEIKTYGFRGEALASICSVAQVEIRTRQEEDKIGWKLISEPLKDAVIEPVICDKGTQIFVKNLFYNVPARRKFLRTNLTEFRYIADTVIKFAISNYNKRFTFYDYDQLIFDLIPDTFENRIIKTLGKELIDHLIPVNYSNNYLKISGFIGTKEIARKTKSNQYLFLNGRSIVNRSINFAIYSCYEAILDKNKHPFYILMLEIDPKKVDVNIHPQKNEVKFDDDKIIFNSVFESIIKSLKTFHQIPDIDYFEKLSQFPLQKELSTHQFPNKQQILVNKITGEIIDNQVSKQNFIQPQGNFIQGQRFKENPKTSYTRNFSAYDILFGKPNIIEKRENIKPEELINIEPQIKILGYLAPKYLFALSQDDLLIINTFAATERILYETFRNTENTERLRQNMLFPIKLNLPQDQIATLRMINNELERLGFEIVIESNSTINLIAIPSEIKSGDEINILKEIIEELENQEITEFIYDKISLKLAKSLALRKGPLQTKEEMEEFVNKLFTTTNPFFSPSKKTIIKILKNSDIDNYFA